MKKIMNKIINFLGSIILGFMFFGMTVFASENVAIVENFTGEDYISIYIKGMEEEIQDVSVQIGTTVAKDVTAEKIRSLDIPLQTLVMIDNSLSISDSDREKIAVFIQDLISDRLNNEEIAIATFSEDITYLTDYTSDYGTLKKAAESIEYQDQETYLTDVLYELLSTDYIQRQENIYRRIIVVSDGVDNKSLGYTKDELYTLIKDNPLPIYTIGCVNGKNNEQMENMFALSRMTSAASFVLDDIENTLDITAIMKQDCEIVKLTIIPTPEAMDGSKKAVKVSFSNAAVQNGLSADILMPQKQLEVMAEIPAESVVEETEETVEETVEAEIEDNILKKTNVFIFAGVALAVIIIVIIILICVFSRKKKKVTFESIDEGVLRELEKNISEPEAKTELIHTPSSNDDGQTYMIWENKATYQVVLTDVNSPMKSFQIPLSQSVVIGRKQEQCDIALDYEKSVSSKHCQINVRDGKFYIRDLQSANGTYVNESKVLTETEIVSGNVIRMGRLKMRFEIR